MLVEVNKHTEGSKEKNLRPNGLPESLIRYDGMVVLNGSSSISISLQLYHVKTNDLSSN